MYLLNYVVKFDVLQHLFCNQWMLSQLWELPMGVCVQNSFIYYSFR